MPQATDLVLTNALQEQKTFVLAAPAAGNSPATWFLREGAHQGVFPSIEMASRRSGTSGSARRVTLSLVVPNAIVSATGQTTRSGTYAMKVDVAIPDSIPDTTREDAIAFLASAFQTDLVKACFATGFSAT